MEHDEKNESVNHSFDDAPETEHKHSEERQSESWVEFEKKDDAHADRRPLKKDPKLFY